PGRLPQQLHRVQPILRRRLELLQHRPAIRVQPPLPVHHVAIRDPGKDLHPPLVVRKRRLPDDRLHPLAPGPTPVEPIPVVVHLPQRLALHLLLPCGARTTPMAKDPMHVPTQSRHAPNLRRTGARALGPSPRSPDVSAFTSPTSNHPAGHPTPQPPARDFHPHASTTGRHPVASPATMDTEQNRTIHGSARPRPSG